MGPQRRWFRAVLALLVWLAFAALPVEAAVDPVPFLVDDIRDAGVNLPDLWELGYLPFAELDGVLYFDLDDGVHGLELWRTDGTTEGTGVVRDLCPGQCPGRNGYSWTTPFGDLLYFAGTDPEHGRELWATDGTSTGTFLVADILAGVRGSFPFELTVAGDRLFFRAWDPEHGEELWVTTATGRDARLVRDIFPGAESARPAGLVAAGDRVFFSADDGTHGNELWVSDGREAGTEMVEDLWPGPNAGVQAGTLFDRRHYYLEALRDGVVFHGMDGFGPTKLWWSDGREAGTHSLAAVQNPGGFAEMDEALYFSGWTEEKGQELWRTDGTDAGTFMVADIVPGPGSSGPIILAADQDVILLSAETGDQGREPWKSDGTAGGTTLLKDITPGPESSLSVFDLFPRMLSDGKLLFQATRPDLGWEPWVTDFTPGGTELLKDITPGPDSTPALRVGSVVFRGHFYFLAFTAAAGWELWTSDGSREGTGLLADLNQQVSSIHHISNVGQYAELSAAGHRLVFSADDGSRGWEPWGTDGAPEGTSLLGDIGVGPLPSFPQEVTTAGTRVFFRAQRRTDESGSGPQQVWLTDGTPEGTRLVKDFGADSYPILLTALGDKLFFEVSDDLWRSDGSETGTYRLTSGPILTAMTAAGDRLFFLAHDAARQSSALYRLDAETETISEIGLVPSLEACGGHPLMAPTPSGGVYFPADDGLTGCEPWWSDGEEVKQVADLAPGPDSSMSGYLWIGRLTGEPSVVAVGNRAYLVASGHNHGEELWITDGTEGGTELLCDICPGACSSSPRHLTAVNDLLYFVADDGSTGRELWRTDGSRKGTVLVRDLLPGPESSLPDYLHAVDGTLYFSARDGVHGVELWRSDGTGPGTSMVADLNPTGSASPQFLTTACPNLYFTANDGVHGFEPWAVPVYDGVDVVVADERVNQRTSFTACETLVAGGGLVVDPTGELALRAGRTVILRDRFAVRPGGRLTVLLDPALAGLQESGDRSLAGSTPAR